MNVLESDFKSRVVMISAFSIEPLMISVPKICQIVKINQYSLKKIHSISFF